MVLDGGEGRRLGNRFVLEEVIGQGGMGTVWQAWDTLLDRPVAVKEIALPPAAEAQPKLRNKVLREARLAARLSHPGAVTVFDAIEADGQVFIIMELVRARTLHDLVNAQGPLPPATVAQLGLRVLDVLLEAHRLGIVHRDVKPGNIMVGANGSVKLADFGIARLDSTDATMTATGVLVGSPAYMAPEHIRDHAAPSSDLWALGATLFFALEGFSPFQRETAGASIAAVLSENTPSPMLAGDAFGELLLQMLAKDVRKRPQADEIRRRLTDIAHGRVGPQDEPPRPVVPPPEGQRPAARRSPPVPTKPPTMPLVMRRDGWLVLAGVLCLLGFAWWGVTALSNSNVQLSGVSTTAVVQRDLSAGGASLFVMFWAGDPPTIFAGKYAGAPIPVQSLMLVFVSLPFLALLPAGLVLLGRRRQLLGAAMLAGSAALWVPGAYDYAVFALQGAASGAMMLFGVLARAVTAIAVVIAAVRALRSDGTWLCRRNGHWGLAAAVLACAALWLVTDLGAAPNALGGIVVAALTNIAVALLAGLLAPHRIGSRVLAGWLSVLGVRVAVDLMVLANFDGFGFTNGKREQLIEAPTEFILSVMLTIAAVLAATVLAAVLSSRSHDRAEGVFDRAL